MRRLATARSTSPRRPSKSDRSPTPCQHREIPACGSKPVWSHGPPAIKPGCMPCRFEWCTCYVNDDAELKEIYSLLSNHYVEDDDNMFRCAHAGPRSRVCVWWGGGAGGRQLRVGEPVRILTHIRSRLAALPAGLTIPRSSSTGRSSLPGTSRSGTVACVPGKRTGGRRLTAPPPARLQEPAGEHPHLPPACSRHPTHAHPCPLQHF
jgi:hypothetical protein